MKIENSKSNSVNVNKVIKALQLHKSKITDIDSSRYSCALTNEVTWLIILSNPRNSAVLNLNHL